MSLFNPCKLTSDKLADLPIKDGQLIVTTDTKKLYVDVSPTTRIEVKSDAEVDLTDYVTQQVLTASLGEEASEREKQDSLLEDLINTKLDTSSADNRYALKNNPELTGDVSITNAGWALGKITAAHPNNDDTDLTYYKYVIGFDSLHRPYFAKYEGETKVSTIYLGSESVILDQPIDFTDASGVGSNSSAANQTRINIGAAAANHTHDLASDVVDGFMPSEDKVKLNNLDSTISAAVNAEATERQQQDTVLENAINGKLGQDNILAGNNISLQKDGINNVTINAYGYYAGNGIAEDGRTFSLKIQDESLNADVGQELEGFILMPHSTTENGLYGHSIPYDTGVFTGGSSNLFTIKDGGITAEKLADGVIPEVEDVTLASLGVTATAEELNYVDGVTSNIQTQLNDKAAISHSHSASDITSGTFPLDRIPTITDAKISGISASKITGTISSANLPSYVDDVLEYNGTSAFPEEGEAGKIYVDTSTNKTYRWSGSDYVEISASLALGTTSSTAFRGDYGNTAYQHATAKGSAFSSGLYKITTNAQGHVTAATAVTKGDITALGIPGSDTNTNTTYTLTKSGSTITLTGSDGSKTSVTDADTNTTYSNMSGATSSAAGKAGLVPAPAAGASNRYLRSDGTWTVPPDTNTTYTLSSFGITATAAELNKLDGCTATVTELNYLDGVTSKIQTQLNGKAASSHTHSYLPLSGGTLTGRLTANGKISAPTSGGSWITGMTVTNATLGITTTNTSGSYHPIIACKTYGGHFWNLGTITNTVGFYGYKSGRTENATDWAFTIDVTTGNVNSTDKITAPTFVGALSGNATTATTATQANYWTTARTLTFSGDATGSVSIRGNANMSCTLSLAANSVTANEIAANAVGSSEIASGAVGLSELSSAVGTVAVQSATPTDSHVKLWIKV